MNEITFTGPGRAAAMRAWQELIQKHGASCIVMSGTSPETEGSTSSTGRGEVQVRQAMTDNTKDPRPPTKVQDGPREAHSSECDPTEDEDDSSCSSETVPSVIFDSGPDEC